MLAHANFLSLYNKTIKDFTLKIKFLALFFLFIPIIVCAQYGSIEGLVSDLQGPVPYATLVIKELQIGTQSDQNGRYEIKKIPVGSYTLEARFVTHQTSTQNIIIKEHQTLNMAIALKEKANALDQIVISGSLKPISKSQSPVAIDVYGQAFFKANPTPSVYEALQNVNGVRPQVNCSVCNTGDIHINGLEGAYTMVTIDGMPIVSGLSTVYGLSGIPQALIERIELIKGPASTLYGSESVAGLINIITKHPDNAALFSSDIFASHWGELSADISGKIALKKAQSLLGINCFKYQNPVDNNQDGFTDVTLQDRISLFNKWNFKRKKGRVFSLAARYVYEDRFGGDLNWKKQFRGTDQIYGESIYTNRYELFGSYQLPFKERTFFSFSANSHKQNSVYGNLPFLATQNILFTQLTRHKSFSEKNTLLLGAALRYTYYDDNTPATESLRNDRINNSPSKTLLPGLFAQNTMKLNVQNSLLLGLRYDYNSLHGSIITPRLNYKLSSKNKLNVLRFSLGNGYRIANVFTEDHAALSGARELIFLSNLKPERSYNANLNFVKKIFTKKEWMFSFDASVFYTYFTNKIFPDYNANSNAIIYDNLNGHAVSNGISLNTQVDYKSLNMVFGGTLMDVYSVENQLKERQLLTENFTLTWSVGYRLKKQWKFDYTGNLYSSMLLPLLGPLDPRPGSSPWYSIQNIQLTKAHKSFEFYGGVKNILNWVPWRNLDQVGLIARSFDPFDKQVEFDPNAQAISTANNPYALTFDPTYIYSSNQGIRGFFGVRYTFQKRVSK